MQCLLPLLNSPLLAWTLESLAADGVEEIFIFVRDGVSEVRDWLRCVFPRSDDGPFVGGPTCARPANSPAPDSSSTYSGGSSPLQITLRPTTALTSGDVLREVDSLQILAPADFLVVQAGYVGSLSLGDRVKEFTSRRTRDPNLCLACVVAPTSLPSAKYAVHVLEGPDDRLLHYEESRPFPRIPYATIPREQLEGNREVHARVDLEAVGVAICSVEVPPLFTENFDYQFVYPDFVNGILTSDLLGKTICATVVGAKGEWGGVVGNTRSYDLVRCTFLSSLDTLYIQLTHVVA